MAVTGRPREFDRDAALEAAMTLFWRNGWSATSMADLCDVMHIRSPSLYAAFGSKEALYLEAFERYVGAWGPPIWDRLADGDSARAGVEQMLLAAARRLPRQRGMPAGCMAALAAASDDLPEAIASAVKKVRRNMLEFLRTRLRDAVSTGELGTAADADRLARLYLGVYLGMALQARDGATAAELKGLAEAAMAAWPGRD